MRYTGRYCVHYFNGDRRVPCQRQSKPAQQHQPSQVKQCAVELLLQALLLLLLRCSHYAVALSALAPAVALAATLLLLLQMLL
jgi:hypothetical protein